MARVAKDAAPAAKAAGAKVNESLGEGFGNLSKSLSKKVNTSIRQVGVDAIPHTKVAGKKIAVQFGNSFGGPLSKAIRGKINNAILVEGRHLLPDADNLGHLLGTEFMESFTVAIPEAVQRKRNAISRAVTRTLSGAWRQVRADQGGRDLGNRFINGFVGVLSKFRIPPLVWIGFFALPAIAGILKIIAAYVASAVSLVSAVGPAVAAAGVAGAAGVAVLGGAIAAVMLGFKTKSKDLKKFKEITKDIGKEFEAVGRAAQKKMLPRIADALDITTQLIPTLKTGMKGIGGAIGNVAIQLAKTLTSKRNLESLNGVLKATPGILKPLGSALGSVVGIFLNLAQAGAPVLQQFAEFTAEWLRGKDAALQAAEASGRLQRFIGRSVTVAKQIGRIFGNIGRGIAGIFKAAYPSGQNLLGSIEKITRKFDKWVNSDYGRSQLKKFFDNSRDIVKEVNGLIGDLLKALGKPIADGSSDNIVTFVKTLRTDVLPVLKDLATEAGKLGPKLVPLFKSLTELIKSMNEKGALGSFFDTLGKIVDLMTKLFKMPVVGDLLGWALAFGGMFKAVDLVLKPIGGLRTILRPLGRLLFGTKDKAGLLTKAFEGLSKTKVGKFFGRVRDGVKSIGSKLWSGAARAVRTGVGGIVRAIGGLARGIAGAVGRMLSGAARLIPWKNLFTGGAAKVAGGAARVGPWFALGLGKIKWAAVFKGIGKKIFGPLAAAITINDIGHALIPTVDKIASWITTKLPEPVAKAFQAAYVAAMSHPILRDMRKGTDQILDNIWPDRWPWEDPIPPPNDGNLKRGLTTITTAVSTAVSTLGIKLNFSGIVTKIQEAGGRLNTATHGAFGKVVAAITAKGRTILTTGAGVFTTFVGAIRTVLTGGRKGVDGATHTMLNGILGIAKAAVNPVPGAVKAAMNATAAAIAATKAAVKGATTRATNDIKPTVRAAVSGLNRVGAGGISSFAGGMRSMVGAVSSAARKAKAAAHISSFSLKDAGSAVIGSFVRGMRSRIQDVIDAAIATTNAVLANKGPIERDRVLLTPAGEAVMQSFVNGIKNGRKNLVTELRGLTADIPGMIGDPRDAALGIATPGLPGSTRSIANSTTNNIRVYNPINEKTSQSLTRKNTRVGRIGAFA
jgi:hypothetical protein